MASAVDSRLAYARLSAVATASRLPTANRGSNNSYTTSWDTTLSSPAGTVNLMAAGERLSPIAFVKRPLLLPAIPPWLRCEIGEASGGKSGGAGR